MGWNGLELAGMDCNGLEWAGMGWNGLERAGMCLNGLEWGETVFLTSPSLTSSSKYNSVLLLRLSVAIVLTFHRFRNGRKFLQLINRIST